jgi:Na+-transporting methylmalonyl-CoA/oxaloacetate decarboxylase gamma subunit
VTGPSALGKHYMDNAKWSFGLTMMIVGMGGTFLTLWILGLVMDLLKKVFPLVIVSSAGSPEKK